MEIVNGSLIVKVGTKNVTTVMPEVASDAVVKAWSVPAAYRANGLFISVTLPGQAEEVPACNMADTQFFGEVKQVAGSIAKLDAAKSAKHAEVNAACNTAISQLAAFYPEREVQSWPQQVKEAEALAISPIAPAPLLAAIATARGVPVTTLAALVLTKMTAYATVSGGLIGRRQVAENLITFATTPEALALIVW